MADPMTLRRLARSQLDAMVSACGPRRIGQLLALQILAAATEAAALILLVPVIRVVSGAREVTVPILGPVSDWVALLALVVAVIVRAALQWWTGVTANDVRVRTSDFLRLQALRALFSARWVFVASRRRSHVVQSLTTEAMRTMAATDLLIQSSVSGFVLLATAAVTVAIAPLVGGLAVLGVVVVAAVARTSVARSARLGAAVGRQIDAFGGAVTDSLSAARVIRVHDAQERWHRLAEDEAGRARHAMQAYVRTTTAVRVTLGVLSVAAAIALVLAGRAQGLDTARVIALAVLATRLVTATQALVSEVQHFANLAPALHKLTELTESARREPEVAGAVDGRAPAAAVSPHLVELRGVQITYPGTEEPALRGVDLTLRSGALTVVSGPSGAGKSTLVDVVLGLLPPDRGDVLVDGEPLTELAGWRLRVGYVPQESVLVPGTVWDNLVWSLQPGRQVTEADAWRALEEASLGEVVRRLPRGLETWLAENAELSGGEKQRLSLARALIRDPGLLVLDEATSSLDSETERLVLDHLRTAGRTTLFVSHRSQVRDAADVVVDISGGLVRAGLDEPSPRRGGS